MNIRNRKIVIRKLLILLAFSTGNASATRDTWFANGDGTVIDVATGLIWQQQDDAIVRTHADAITYCQGLSLAGASDWRLPNIKELSSIVDYRSDSPAIDAAAFLETLQSYWSATLDVRSTDGAWFVFFVGGTVAVLPKNTPSLLARCVR